MPSASRLVIVLLAWAALLGPSHAAAPATVRSSPDGPGSVFGLTRLWNMHLTVTARDWETMQPRRGGLGPAGVPGKAGDDGRIVRSQFGFDFEYVRGDLEIEGVRLPNVGVRFKGNSSYALTARVLKRPFKIDLDRYEPGQTFRGLKMLALNNNIMDASLSREALGYQLYRDAGVPAPRTAFALLTLTVPGKYDRTVVGLYTLIEVVDKVFLEERFGTKKGMLLKPERVGPLDHLGPNWSAYEEKYRPKVKPSKKAQERFIEFTRLVQDRDEKRFHREIANYLDVDAFLRYLAVTSLMASLDSFMGLPHNYYIYFDPKKDRFLILPWDLDHSFGGLLMFGNANDVINLSVTRPWWNRNPLIEKLLRNEKIMAAYKAHMQSLMRTSFTPERIKTDMAAIHAAVATAREEEKKAVSKRGDAWTLLPFGMMLAKPPAPDEFTKKRVVAVQAQLDGKSKGWAMGTFGPRPPAAMPVPVPMKELMTAVDANRDGKITLDEAKAGLKLLFKQCADPSKGAEVDEKALVAGLKKLWPKGAVGPWVGLFRQPSPIDRLAKGIVHEAGRGGKVSEACLLAAAERLFVRADAGKAGAIKVPQIEAQLRGLMTPPVRPSSTSAPPLPTRQAMKAADSDGDGKLSLQEAKQAARALFRYCGGDRGDLDEKALAAGLEKLWPGTGSGSGPSLAARLAKGIVREAGKAGKVSESSLVAAAERVYTRFDLERTGRLDERRLEAALRFLMPPPGGLFGLPTGPRAEVRP